MRHLFLKDFGQCLKERVPDGPVVVFAKQQMSDEQVNVGKSGRCACLVDKGEEVTPEATKDDDSVIFPLNPR